MLLTTTSPIGIWIILFALRVSCERKDAVGCLVILSRYEIWFMKLILSCVGWFPLVLNLTSYSVMIFFVMWDVLSWCRVVCRVMASLFLCCLVRVMLLQQEASEDVVVLFFCCRFKFVVIAIWRSWFEEAISCYEMAQIMFKLVLRLLL